MKKMLKEIVKKAKAVGLGNKSLTVKVNRRSNWFTDALENIEENKSPFTKRKKSLK